MTEAVIVSAVLILLRTASFVAFLPPLSGRQIPTTVRVGFAVVLALTWTPRYLPTIAAELLTANAGDLSWSVIGYFAIRETLLGVALAWALSLLLVPMKIAGAYISQEMGLTLGGLASASAEQPATVISEILESLGLLTFFLLDGHQFVLSALAFSYQSHPIARTWSLPESTWLTNLVQACEVSGLMIAAPVAIVLFITLVALLLTMRSAPHFNLLSLGMSIRLLAGLAGLIVFLPEITQGIQRTFDRMQHLLTG